MYEIRSVTAEWVGTFWAGSSICWFVSIQGHFPKREAWLLTPPLSGTKSTDQGPPRIREEEEGLFWALGKGRERHGRREGRRVR